MPSFNGIDTAVFSTVKNKVFFQLYLVQYFTMQKCMKEKFKIKKDSRVQNRTRESIELSCF